MSYTGWNYRVVKRELKEGEGDFYGIYEVYYEGEDKESALPTSITASPVEITGDEVGDIVWVLERMGDALNKTILDYEDIVTSAGG